MDAQNVVPVHASSVTNTSDQPRPSSPTSTDGGWGELENGLLHEDHDSDKEGWDDIDPVEEKKPPLLASIQAAQKRPVVQTMPGKHACFSVNHLVHFCLFLCYGMKTSSVLYSVAFLLMFFKQ